MAAQQFCGACGKPNREQARFCGYCGRPLWPPPPRTESVALESLKGKIRFLKSLALILIVVAVCGLFVYTNPTLEQYELFLRQKLRQEAKTDEERAVAALLGGVASWVVIQQTVRSDYLFFSLYETQIANEQLSTLGMLNTFIVLAGPRSVSTRR